MRTSRIIAVGDDKQAIYLFRGADSGSMENFRIELGAKVLPLSVTYRCAKNIVTYLNAFVPDLQAAPDAIDGEVLEVSYQDMIKNVRAGDFIISRTNAPMIGIAMRLIKEGRPCNIQGRDIGVNFAIFIKKSKCTDIGSFQQYVCDWRARECERIAKKNGNSEPITDKASCLLALCEGCATIKELSKTIQDLFDNVADDKKIVLGTTHKLKGLERNRVFALMSTFKPGKGDEEQNIIYVACSRARESLFLVQGLKNEVVEE